MKSDTSAYQAARDLIKVLREDAEPVRAEVDELVESAPLWWGRLHVKADPTMEKIGKAIESVLRKGRFRWDDLVGDPSLDAWVVKVHPIDIRRAVDELQDAGFTAIISEPGREPRIEDGEVSIS